MLNYELPPVGGGAGNASYYLLKQFAGTEISIDLITSSPGRYKKERFSDNITLYRLDVGKKNLQIWTMKEIAIWSAKAYDLMARLQKRQNYDLCHAWFSWPSGAIAYMHRLPYIVSLCGSDVPGHNPRFKILDKVMFRPLSRLVWKNAKQVIPNSKGLRNLAQRTLDREFRIIENGVDTEHFLPGKKYINGPLKVISVGRLNRIKGYEYLIRALADWSGPAELTLIGDGNLKEELENLANKLKVHLNLPGRQDRDEITRHLQESHIFVLPSLSEGMSNALLEAMSCGLPVIVTDVGGSEELINGNGFIVKSGSVRSLRKALARYKDHELIHKHGLVSRSIAEQMNWTNVACKFEEIYDSIKKKGSDR